jgi:adenosylhomocysteine nucleosidase
MKNIALFVALESELPTENLPENVEIYYTGVGKVNAAIKATSVLSVKDSKNTLVINYGSAGSKVLNKNSLYRCTSFEQADMDARPLTDSIGETPYDEMIYDNMSKVIMFDEDVYGSGYLCSTADKFQENPSAHLVDMESYSIAKVCKIFGFDFVAYKFVSDDGNSQEWKENHMNGIFYFLKELEKIISKCHEG